MKNPRFKIGDIVGIKIIDNSGKVTIKKTTIHSVKYLASENILTFNGFKEHELIDLKIKELSCTTTYPKCWADVKEFVSNRPSDNILTRWAEICNLIEITEDYATAEYWKHIYFMQLILLRDIYRQDWKPDWTDVMIYKYCISTFNNELVKMKNKDIGKVLSFQTERIRNLFFENFRDLIEECKEFI